MTAMYKGYSNSGETLEEIQDTIKDLHRQEASLQRQIDDAQIKVKTLFMQNEQYPRSCYFNFGGIAHYQVLLVYLMRTN